MTLVALTYFRDCFTAVSDSRVSAGRKLDLFPKIFVHPYNFTSGHPSVNPPKSFTGNVGIAFSGSTLTGTAFSGIFARTIAAMHSFEVVEAPSFEAFCKIALHCANILCDSILESAHIFEAIVFGFCPRTSKPKFSHITLCPKGDRTQAVLRTKDALEDMLFAIGSGAKHLSTQNFKPSEIPLEVFVSRIIFREVDGFTGGGVQVLELHKENFEFFGTMHDGESWDDGVYSNVKRGDLGVVDGYNLGRNDPINLKPYDAILNSARKRTVHSHSTGKHIALSKVNNPPFLTFLKVIHKEAARGFIDQRYLLGKSPLLDGQRYFSKVCPHCWRNSPSIISPAEDSGFRGIVEGAGSVVTSCQFCGGEIIFLATDFQRETTWKN